MKHRLSQLPAGHLLRKEMLQMKALIAMSGGVDSSVAAQIMSSRGYECVGCTMRLYENDVVGKDLLDTCCSLENTQDARSVTEKIGIPYHIFHYENHFREQVIEPFIDEYLHGRTPNPCIECNRCLKFQHLFEKMKELGCDILVTGHYARIKYDPESGRYLLLKALDPAKDQSYVLYMMTQEMLSHVQFPLGDQDKQRTREIAAEKNFVNAEKHDSQDICFVPDGDYAGFIQRYTGRECPAGDFVDAEGHVLGRHKGIIHYTLGQRRGLGIPAEHRLFVTKIDPESNTVTLGSNEDLMQKTLYARRINLITTDRIEGSLRCSAKIRYRHKEQPCTVTQPEDDLLRVEFDQPQRAITPGQSVVLYDGDVVVGGGIIS